MKAIGRCRGDQEHGGEGLFLMEDAGVTPAAGFLW